MKCPEPCDVFGLYAEERWSVTVSGKERGKNDEVRKQADKGRLKQSGFFKLKKKRWGEKGNNTVGYAKGCCEEESPNALQRMDGTTENGLILQQECSRASSLFSSMMESPGKVLVEIVVSTQTCIKNGS